MTHNDFLNFAKNKIGEIYVARNGTVMVFIIKDITYLLSTTVIDSAVIINPAKDYWIHSIDFCGGFIDYFTYQMCPPDTLTYKADPIVPMQQKFLDKLKSFVK